MADTTTTNLALTKPEIGAANDTWGTKLNADLDILDALFSSGPVAKNAGYTTTATAAGTTTLTAASTFFQYFTGATTQTIVLPVTSTLTLGWTYLIVNNSTGILTVNSSGANLVTTVPAGAAAKITCILTSGTSAASWESGITDFSTYTGTGSVVLSDSPTFTTLATFPAGAVATPSITTVGDLNTGFWFPAADTIAASTGGSERFRVDNAGNFGIGGTPSSYTNYTAFTLNGLDIQADFKRSGVTTASFFTTSTAFTFATITNIPFKFGANNQVFFTLDTNQNVLVTGSGGLGYGTGSGGTVTQITSKSTGVTLNKLVGQITMSNAALAANTTVSFVVSNSAYTTSIDTPITVITGGVANGGNYLCWASNGGAGSFQINVRNISAGSLSEAVAINFFVFRGATS